MPDRIGTIGNTQGVNARPMPTSRNTSIANQRLPPRRLFAKKSALPSAAGAGSAARSSGALGAIAARAAASSPALAAGIDTVKVRVIGG